MFTALSGSPVSWVGFGFSLPCFWIFPEGQYLALWFFWLLTSACTLGYISDISLLTFLDPGSMLARLSASQALYCWPQPHLPHHACPTRMHQHAIHQSMCTRVFPGGQIAVAQYVVPRLSPGKCVFPLVGHAPTVCKKLCESQWLHPWSCK